MRDWFAGLNQREQLSVLVLAVALGLYLLYMLAWAPLADRREQLEQQNRGIATSLQRVDAMVSQIMQLRDGGGADTSQRNLTALVNQSTGRHGLQRMTSFAVFEHMQRGGILIRVGPAKYLRITKLTGIRATEQITWSWCDRTRPECCRDSIVIRLWYRIEFVIMATCALRGHSEKGRRCGVHEVLKPFVLVIFRIIGLIVPCSEPQKTRGNDGGL